jgi:hypothetical protein
MPRSGTRWCIVILADGGCTSAEYAIGPYTDQASALKALARKYKDEKLVEDEYGIFRNENDDPIAQVVTIEAPRGTIRRAKPRSPKVNRPTH